MTSITVNYQEYLRSPEWRAKRRERLLFAHNDGHDCYLCDSCRMFVWRGAIEIHHWTYDRLGHEEMTDLSVLCEGCHTTMHGLTVPQWYLDRLKLGHIQRWDSERLEFEMQELLKSGQYENRKDDLTRNALIMCAPRVTKEECAFDKFNQPEFI